MDYELVKRPKFIDRRGFLGEFLTRDELEEPKIFGHIYFVTFARPGIVRGNHYHAKKGEYFGVASGKVQIDIEDIKTKERKSFILDADDEEFIRLKIGPNIAHAVKSLSPQVVLIDYFPIPYNHENPDSHKYVLLEEEK